MRTSSSKNKNSFSTPAPPNWTVVSAAAGEAERRAIATLVLSTLSLVIFRSLGSDRHAGSMLGTPPRALSNPSEKNILRWRLDEFWWAQGDENRAIDSTGECPGPGRWPLCGSCGRGGPCHRLVLARHRGHPRPPPVPARPPPTRA